jgi:uncharacterized protein
MNGNKFIDTFVVKVASRCNLNCTYCYMYNKGDDSYKTQPKVMSKATIDNLLQKVVTHCTAHEVTSFSMILHGGEPLLAGVDRIRYFIEKARELTKDIELDIVFSMQTNAILITKEWCDFFNEYDISIGISIDGEKEINDKFRVDHKGRGSYDNIVKGIRVVNEHYKEQLGVLSVIDIDSDPVKSLMHLISLEAKRVDFLFPDNNYADPPQRPVSGNSETPYGDWLVRLYDHWNSLPPEIKPELRLFINIIYNFCSVDVSSDSMGGGERHVLVIETNGDIESVDSLKICGDNFTKGNVNINRDEIEAAFGLRLANLYYDSATNVSKKCNTCPIFSYCGGGFIPHRYSTDNEFNNPTIYCKDYIRLISHVQNSLIDELPAEVIEMNPIDRLSYTEVVNELDIANLKFY